MFHDFTKFNGNIIEIRFVKLIGTYSSQILERSKVPNPDPVPPLNNK
jgi:hypothetical protein